MEVDNQKKKNHIFLYGIIGVFIGIVLSCGIFYVL